jgi:hypothetical protein
MSEDRELKAMGVVLGALEPLDTDERKRVLSWLTQKLSVAVPVGSSPAPKSLATTSGEKWNLSTDTIATIIGARSGRDLIMAAAGHLHFGQGKQTFNRHDLTAQMRSATGHFRSSYVNNLSSYLASLTRADRLRLSGNDTYALSNRERLDLEAKLAAAE